MGGGFLYPEGVRKRDRAEDLNDEKLVYLHDKLHVLWKKLEEGYNFEWTFSELYMKHMEVVMELGMRELGHIAPINELDLILVA
jgi:hypothetical protein